ncbi:MAG: AGE family epimerase/isomerase [Vallitaleaceae bacterium]|nr:AGE family epimerase/isomerase [Vallitaleaceae bacterium]
MQTIIHEFQKELEEHILPFWLNLQDQEFGVHYGSVNYNLVVDKKAPKGGIAVARYLWTFSSAYRVLGDETYLKCAKQAYDFYIKFVLDPEGSGALWLVDYQGKVLDDRKHIYAQAFGIYALSEYYRATQDEEALKHALKLYNIIESIGFNTGNNAYKEEFTRQWVEASNEMLSENGVMAQITYNTHLHILEAYTNLYRVWPDKGLRGRIENLLELFYQKIYNPITGYFKVFFNDRWEEIIDLKSFGHDIEASWLLDEALKVLGNTEEKYQKWILEIAKNIQQSALKSDGSLVNECEKGVNDDTKIWWVHCEAIIGFYNAYEHTLDETFLESIKKVWKFVKVHLIDSRQGGEWLYSVDPQDKPIVREIVEPWKCPYHNSRFCLEIIERVGRNGSH